MGRGGDRSGARRAAERAERAGTASEQPQQKQLGAVAKGMPDDGRKGGAASSSAVASVATPARCNRARDATSGNGKSRGQTSALEDLMQRKGVDEAWNVLEEMQRRGVTTDKYTVSRMLMKTVGEGRTRLNPLRVYRSISLVERFIEMQPKDVDAVLFNALLDTCCRLKDLNRLEATVKRMRELKVCPSSVTLGILVKTYGQAGDMQKVLQVWDEMEKQRGQANAVTYGCMIDACVKCGRLEKAVEIFSGMREAGKHRNTILYTTLIKGYGLERDLASALALFREMPQEGVPYNTITYNSILEACVKCGDLATGESLLREMTAPESALEPDLITLSTMLKGYCHVGELDKALEVTEAIKGRGLRCDELVYNTLMDGCVKANDVSAGVGLFEEMVQNGLRPSIITHGILARLYQRAGNDEDASGAIAHLYQEHGIERPTGGDKVKSGFGSRRWNPRSPGGKAGSEGTPSTLGASPFAMPSASPSPSSAAANSGLLGMLLQPHEYSGADGRSDGSWSATWASSMGSGATMPQLPRFDCAGAAPSAEPSAPSTPLEGCTPQASPLHGSRPFLSIEALRSQCSPALRAGVEESPYSQASWYTPVGSVPPTPLGGAAAGPSPQTGGHNNGFLMPAAPGAGPAAVMQQAMRLGTFGTPVHGGAPQAMDLPYFAPGGPGNDGGAAAMAAPPWPFGCAAVPSFTPATGAPPPPPAGNAAGTPANADASAAAMQQAIAVSMMQAASQGVPPRTPVSAPQAGPAEAMGVGTVGGPVNGTMCDAFGMEMQSPPGYPSMMGACGAFDPQAAQQQQPSPFPMPPSPPHDAFFGCQMGAMPQAFMEGWMESNAATMGGMQMNNGQGSDGSFFG